MRLVEAQYGTWYLWATRNTDNPSGIAVRIDSRDTLILFRDVYRLVDSNRQKESLISESSVSKDNKELVYIPAISVNDSATGMELRDSTTGAKIYSFGAFLNIDKIFKDNQWCNFIVVDDLAEGYIFYRDSTKFIELSYEEYQQLTQCKIVGESRNYNSLIQIVD
jgi:hypothetical protein